jgi:hypothetical protein
MSSQRRNLVTFAIALVLVVSGYLYGVVSYRYELFPFFYVKKLIDVGVFDRLAVYGGYDISFDRSVVSCRDVGRGAVVLMIFGQSNSANSSAERFDAVPGVYNFNMLDGRCYEARDPLLGAGGDGGSAWMPLARLFIERGLASRVVIAPIGLGGSRVIDWTPGGGADGRIRRALMKLVDAELRVDALLWQQGESDHKTSAGEYEQSFLRVVNSIRQLGVDAPIYIARSTYCDGVESSAIRDAQTKLATGHPGLRPGPDTDVLVGAELRNGCHFTRRGALEQAALWFAVLEPDVRASIDSAARESAMSKVRS